MNLIPLGGGLLGEANLAFAALSGGAQQGANAMSKPAVSSERGFAREGNATTKVD